MASLDEGFWPYILPVRKAAWMTTILCVVTALFFAMLFAGSPVRLEAMLAEPSMRTMFGLLIGTLSGIGILAGLLIHVLGMQPIWRANQVRQSVPPMRMRLRVYISLAGRSELRAWMAEMMPLYEGGELTVLEVQEPPIRRTKWDGFHGEADVYQQGDVVVIETDYGMLLRKQ